MAAMLSVSRRWVELWTTWCRTVCFMGPLSPDTTDLVLFESTGPLEL